MPFSLAESPYRFNVIYAFVITASKPSLFKNSMSTDCETGCTTGIKAGVSKVPLGVLIFPILPARSEYLTSNNKITS